jgi:hypothetical protein
MPFRLDRLGALGGLAAWLLLAGCFPSPKTELVAVEVSAPQSIPAGVKRQLVATGTFNNGPARDLTGNVKWTSSDPAVASVTDGGLVSTIGPGTATFSATDPGTSIVGTATVTITPASLVSIAVTPTAATVPLGTTARFTATGTYGDGTTQDLTDTVVWSSSATAIVAFEGGAGSTGVASTGTAGTATITALHASAKISGSTTLTVTAAQLVSIAVTPATVSAPVGVPKPLTAIGTYTNGTKQDLTSSVAWSSSDPAVASVSGAGTSSGWVTGTSAGTATIQALDAATHLAGSAVLTVTPAVMVSISVTPTAPSVPLGVKEQLTATGTFSNGTTQDVTQVVTWSSSSASVASVANAIGSRGLATALSTGATTVRATDPTTQATGATTLTVTAAQLASLAVTPENPSVPLGLSPRFTATGMYTNGSTQNLTSAVTWTSSDPSVVSLSNGKGAEGVATTSRVGTATVRATDAATGVTTTTELTVTSAALVSIAVASATPSVPVGLGDAFTATGTYTDGSSQDLTRIVTWSSSSPDVAPVSNAGGSEGVATGTIPGVTTVRAYDAGTGIAGTGTLTVTPARLVTLSVTPETATVSVGGTQQLTATGTYTDGTQHDLTATVTWTSSDGGAVEVSNATGSSGLATGVAPGTAAIEGRDPGTGVAASATITVPPPP